MRAKRPTATLLALALLMVFSISNPEPLAASHAALGGAGKEPVTAPRQQESVNPFTGLTISTGNRRPMLVKVANTATVRPQTGLASADLVFEHYAEGGITRFTALFLTNTPEKVGSVRSCRLIDLELPVILGAGMVCSGTSHGVRQRLLKSKSWEGSNGDIKKTIWMISDLGRFECARQAGCTLPMFHTPDRRAPHNLYANTVNARKELEARGLNQPTTFNTWSFSADAPQAGSSVKSVSIPYTSGAVVWAYNAGSGRWARSISGRVHTDKATNAQLTAANVIVLYAHHAPTDIREDRGGAASIQIQLWGEGPVQVFRDGKVIQGMWKRTGNAGGLTFVDASGATIPLKPGNTWVELAPLNMKVKVS